MPQQGVPPVTLAEFTLSGVNNLYYDESTMTRDAAYPNALLISDPTVSLKIVHRIHVPCKLTPAPLKGLYDSIGFPVGCKSACEANLNGNPCA
ncbi:hypothetical protein PHLCEN_2v8970 [Hermanssonia centrifuga]|uniref:Uncharacterized protein n=1 Tax=Hermanssonia centrifuga TaxID=98765 RepID=A0A2R6NS45_9APHY|nr:hypothetical protein PHLCEN_2v8970 [Hermanssonia centrifuga]